MSLSRGEVNLLSILGLRKLNFIPQHFSKITIRPDIDSKMVESWIEFNLNSRYAIKNTCGLDVNNKMISVLEIGLEDPKELTMLSLGCPFLHKN